MVIFALQVVGASHPILSKIIHKTLIELVKKITEDNLELRKAIKIIWYIISFCIITILLTTFFTEYDFTSEIIPNCDYKNLGKECILCGATRAFFEIANLNFQAAWQLNKASIFLFLVFVTNTAIFFNQIFNTKTNQHYEDN